MTFRIFLIFLCSRGKGESEAPGGGGGSISFIENRGGLQEGQGFSEAEMLDLTGQTLEISEAFGRGICLTN